MTKMCVGIDIAKLTFVAAINAQGKYQVKKFNNQPQGFDDCLNWVEGYFPDASLHICLEATGRYGDALALYFHTKTCLVSVVNPIMIKRFKESHLLRNKTDKVDAKSIYDYCVERTPNAWSPIPESMLNLQVLIKRLDTLNDIVLQENNRLELADPLTKASVARHLDFLKKEVKTLEKSIKASIQGNKKFMKQAALLQSIPGIGKKTIARILGFLAIGNFSHPKKLAAFVGLNPQHTQSGSSINRSCLSRTGHSYLRKMLYMPALVAIQREAKIKQFYERLLQKGKAPKVAIVAVMRKLLHIIYGVLNTETLFDINLSFRV